ncbi:protein phosphatase 1 regulatory subunit 37-like isoform X2 [Centruroides sculpturatus]|uniref:protein phosphatase 1 regulatory subunit 37-like isoform X2 n=1 Tax=Centruroides sculpturatus TaxID=218467 RepID=UPI000C6CDB98|nr:protein phosphatase 1 regulatory subunit 37-like isoform X2 [Centruroides sculpturatus]
MTTDMEINAYDTFLTEKSVSAPTTPTESSKSIQSRKMRCKGRRVNFPNDDMIVTGYVDPPDPWRTVSEAKTDSVLEAYEVGCEKQGVKPLPCIAQQLQGIKAFGGREKDFSLKGENLDLRHCEALEEIFKRVQFKKVDLEECHLDDEGAAALFDMIEYYESANQLTLSLLKNIDSRSWQACSRMLKKTPSLQYLSTKNTGLTEQCLLTLGRALRLGSNLVTLHMENCGLSGKLLIILVAALKLNTALQDLYLGENKMSSSDGIQLQNLVKTNVYLKLLDLSNNNLQDEGLEHLVYGLSEQKPQAGKGLKTLILWNNNLTHKGMESVSVLLSSSKCLENLNIGHNGITNDGIHNMKPGLLSNFTLLTLGLRKCEISCEGAVALAECIADNKHIKKLDLKENDIKAAGLMALALSMKHNNSIESLELDAVITKGTDGFDDHCWILKEMSEYCERNKGRKETVEEKICISPNNKIFKLTPTPPSIKIPNPVPNRFQVSRVFLERETEKPDELKSKIIISDKTDVLVAKDSDINLGNKELQVKKNQPISELDTIQNLSDKLKSSVTIAEDNNNTIWKHTNKSPCQIIDKTVNCKIPEEKETLQEIQIESEMDDEIFIDNSKYPEENIENNLSIIAVDTKSNIQEPKEKTVVFNLPDILSSSHHTKTERRMSTPLENLQKLQCNLKLCKQLDCLDLKSSIPLSPTRLMEGWKFFKMFRKFEYWS